jgi:hypothetical protein
MYPTGFGRCRDSHLDTRDRPRKAETGHSSASNAPKWQQSRMSVPSPLPQPKILSSTNHQVNRSFLFPLLTYRRSSKLFIWLDASILTDEAKRVGSVKTMRGRGNEPKLAGVFTGSNLVIVFLVVLQPTIQPKRSSSISRVPQSTWRIDRGCATEAELQIKCRILNTRWCSKTW